VRLERELGDLGIRVRADRGTDIWLGRRLTDWKLKGVPVRIEVGPRDLAANQVTVVRRDDSQPDLVAADTAAAVAVAAVDAVQTNLHEQAAAMQARRTVDMDPWRSPLVPTESARATKEKRCRHVRASGQ
jgi:prolyl-tRNA synthetase